MKLQKDIKAFEMSANPSMIGDIRPTRDYPAGTEFSDITEFEVWDGEKWASPDRTYALSKVSE